MEGKPRRTRVKIPGANPRNKSSITWAARNWWANLFLATQTEEKLRRENVRNKDQAGRIHNVVGRKVRATMHELGGTMPENLTVAESIKKVESREKKRLKAAQKKITREQS